MQPLTHSRVLLAASVGLLLAAPAALAAQDQNQIEQRQQDQSRVDQSPLPLKPDLPGLNRNHRLILKDGSYQVVTQYEILGARVRYFSKERGDWEELPVDLVDWAATRKWEQEHNGSLSGDATSPDMKEAAELDNEEAAERADQNARMPVIAKGLTLPDDNGVYVLDTYQGTPELVEITAKDVDRDARIRHGLSTLDPMAGARARLELEGEHATVHLHINDPIFYLSLDSSEAAEKTEPELANAITVNTGGAQAAANRKHGARSAQSRFAIVHVEERISVRFVGPVEVSQSDTIVADPNVIPTKVETMPGGRWLRVEPQRALLIGEYALVEIYSPTEMNPMVWDFRIDPEMGDNPGSMGPILDDSSGQ